MHGNAVKRLWLQGCSSMDCGRLFLPWAKQLRCCNCFKFYVCEKYFQWNSVCYQGPSVCVKSRVRSETVVITFNCTPPPDLTESPRHISILFKKVYGKFTDYCYSVAYKLPVTLLRKQLRKCYLFVYFKIPFIIMLLNVDPVLFQ
jgi:hypothetical protein